MFTTPIYVERESDFLSKIFMFVFYIEYIGTIGRVDCMMMRKKRWLRVHVFEWAGEQRRREGAPSPHTTERNGPAAKAKGGATVEASRQRQRRRSCLGAAPKRQRELKCQDTELSSERTAHRERQRKAT